MLHKPTGKSFDALEREVLFDPPGISDVTPTFSWSGELSSCPAMTTIAASSLGMVIRWPPKPGPAISGADDTPSSAWRAEMRPRNNLLNLVVLPAIFKH